MYFIGQMNEREDAMSKPTIKDAIDYLASVCDGAAEDDGSGFNKFDARLGQSLASRSMENWHPHEIA